MYYLINTTQMVQSSFLISKLHKFIALILFILFITLGCESSNSSLDGEKYPPSTSGDSMAGDLGGENNESGTLEAGVNAGEVGGETSSSGAGELTGGTASTVSLSYYHDIKPILERSCTHCHTPGGAGLFDLTNYQAAQMWAPAIVEATQSRNMPPWGAFEEEGCTPSRPWRDDARLSEEEISTLAMWAAEGAPEGDPSEAVSGTPFITNHLTQVDFEGRARAAVEVTPGDDAFVCVVIDPEFEEETWLKGIEFAPDNEALVHHIVLFTDPTRESLNKMDENGIYPCFGSARVPGSVAAAWAPGIQPSIFPPDHAMRMSPGTLLVMQMHYSPQGGASELTDQTTLRLQYANEPPTHEVYLQLMGNLDFTIHPALGLQPNAKELEMRSTPKFVIPAGAEEHRELIRWTYTGDLPGSFDGGGLSGLDQLRLLSIAPHMHYTGVDMKVHLTRPTYGEAACEPGSLNGFFRCANQESCLNSDDVLGCLESQCTTEWDALSLSCWGCAHRVFVGGGSPAEALVQINACERPEESRMSGLEEPAHECLVSTPKYNFEWQRSYSYDVELEDLPTFRPGDVLSIQCGYQNTLDNSLLRQALGRIGLNEPTDVELGDETLDEMCLVGLLFAFERVD